MPELPTLIELLAVIVEAAVWLPFITRAYTVTVPPPPMFPVPEIVTVPVPEVVFTTPVPAVVKEPPEILRFAFMLKVAPVETEAVPVIDKVSD